MKLKTNWHYTKWDGLNILFSIQYIWCLKNLRGTANILLQIPLKVGKKWIFWVHHILWSSKILFWFWIKSEFFFQMVIFATLFRRCPTLWKSTLKMKTLFRRCLTLFNSTLKYARLLLNVLNFNVDVHNVVSTLNWRCATSWRHINLKPTLNRRWNVYWVYSFLIRTSKIGPQVCSSWNFLDF